MMLSIAIGTLEIAATWPPIRSLIPLLHRAERRRNRQRSASRAEFYWPLTIRPSEREPDFNRFIRRQQRSFGDVSQQFIGLNGCP
jgi:hypothetical protein